VFENNLIDDAQCQAAFLKHGVITIVTDFRHFPLRSERDSISRFRSFHRTIAGTSTSSELGGSTPESSETGIGHPNCIWHKIRLSMMANEISLMAAMDSSHVLYDNG